MFQFYGQVSYTMRCVPVNLFITDGRILKCFFNEGLISLRYGNLNVCTFLNRSHPAEITSSTRSSLLQLISFVNNLSLGYEGRYFVTML